MGKEVVSWVRCGAECYTPATSICRRRKHGQFTARVFDRSSCDDWDSAVVSTGSWATETDGCAGGDSGAVQGVTGRVAIKIHAPAVDGKPEFLVELNAAKQMFVESAVKTFILCEALRQADSPNVVQTLSATQLSLDASVWSVDSATFNPPNLIGKVSQRTALEAMVLHSDNTGTDMSIKHVGPEKVREFIASIGLKNTMVPDSTRSLFAYILGAKGYKTFSWEELGAAANAPIVNSPLNKVETMASSANDFISYYSRALQGEFFKNKRRCVCSGEYWRWEMRSGCCHCLWG